MIRQLFNEHVTLWAIWDGTELISIHITEVDGRDALEAHLESYEGYSQREREEAQAAVELVVSVLHRGPGSDLVEQGSVHRDQR